MFFSTTERPLALLHAMFTGCTTHEAILVHTRARVSELVPFPFHTIIYHKNVTLSRIVNNFFE